MRDGRTAAHPGTATAVGCEGGQRTETMNPTGERVNVACVASLRKKKM